MATALECPACGEKHRVERLPDTPTFRCERCGQTLKVPSSGSTNGGTRGAPAPPPRRARASGPEAPAPVGAPLTVSATVTATAPPADGGARPVPPASAPSRRRVHWYWRLLAWIVAVPLGFVLTGWPAYHLDLIRKDDVLNVFVGSGTGRYARLVIGTAVWALVTALLVQLFVEGGRRLAERRRRRRASAT